MFSIYYQSHLTLGNQSIGYYGKACKHCLFRPCLKNMCVTLYMGFAKHQISSEKCSTLIWKMFSSPLKNPSLTLHMELLKRSGLAWKILRPHLKNIQTSPEKCSALVWKPTRLTLHASSGKCSDNDNENLGFWNNVIASLVPIKTVFPSELLSALVIIFFWWSPAIWRLGPVKRTKYSRHVKGKSLVHSQL